MATTDIPVQTEVPRPHLPFSGPAAPEPTVWPVVKTVLGPLASLRLTVALLAMAIFVVLAGTLAQAEMGIERVVNEFFRVRPWGSTFGFAWVPFQIFFPESFFPNPLADSRPIVSGGFWFPGGWLIGLAMFANLLAAHAVRFTVQSKGTRLLAGLVVLVLGILVTAAVVASGSGAGGLQAQPLLSWTVLWRLFQAGVVLVALQNVGLAIKSYLEKDSDRRTAWLLIGATPVTVGLALWAVLMPDIGPSSMRILWQLIKATMAALVLLAGCWLIFRKRAGIVLLHGGVGLLMISELLVGLVAVETQMTLAEGETSSYGQDIRHAELVVIDPSDPSQDTITRFPASRLKTGATLSDKSVPFRLKIDQHFVNGDLVKAWAVKHNPADAGAGLAYVAREIPEVAGTSTGGGVDYPAAYVTILSQDGKTKIGSHLLSARLASNNFIDTVRADGKEWHIALRFARDYKPYSVTLLDVKKEDYVGTDTPKNYSSDVRVEAKGLDPFERHIWMNNPLRFAGETLYQSGYYRDPSGVEVTTLQIVRNTGWMLPYVSCMIVVIGMAAQFLVTLSRFVGRRLEATPARALQIEDEGGRPEPHEAIWRLGWMVPAAMVVIFGGYLAGKFVPPRARAGQPDLVAFGELPIASQGRVKPIDTLARDALKALSNNRQEFKTGRKYGPFDLFSERKPAIEWLLDFIASPHEGAKHRVVRVENDELVALLELPERKDFMYSVVEVSNAVPALAKRVDEVEQKSKEGKVLTPADRAALDLQRKIGVVDLLVRSFQPDSEAISGGVSSLRAYMENYRVFKHGDMNAAQPIPSRNPPLAVFYQDPLGKEKQWETLGHAQLMEELFGFAARSTGERHSADAAVASWTAILNAWNKDDVTAFNAAVSKYRSSLEAKPPTGYVPAKVGFEAYFNHAAPFYYLMVVYAFAALLGACSWLGLSKPLNRAAFCLVVMTFALHTLALIGRIYISGRPPVTNLYSMSVFAGWAAVAFGIGIEALYRLGFGNVLAGVIGFAGLLVAHGLAADGSDTFAVLQAVLDTQFWLATHVVTETLGYAATYAAGFLGLLYVVLGVATTKLGNRAGQGPKVQSVGQSLIRMTYGVLCFALLFSFFGTVLGGLWADDSWGRFWGWDPKENGALIIVLWNALVLHARWGGIVKDRGFAALAVAGNITVSWSGFGTNELGVGLHSYGFTEGVLLALGLFVLSQLVVIAAAMLPKSMWASFRSGAAPA